MIEIEFQYIDGCPNVPLLEEELNNALDEFHGSFNFKKVRISDNEMAAKFKFRGSPTLLINGVDFEYLHPKKEPSLSCRVYPNGIPTKQEILSRLKSFG